MPTHNILQQLLRHHYAINNHKTHSLECRNILTTTQRNINIHSSFTELKLQYIYELIARHDLLSDLIPLAVDYKVNHRYPKLLNIPIQNIAHSRVYIPKSTICGTLILAEIENVKISETSWTKTENLNKLPWKILRKCVSAQKITMNSQLYCNS